MTLTDQELRDGREYADGLAMNQHGGPKLANYIRRLLMVIEDQKQTIADLRKPDVAGPERE